MNPNKTKSVDDVIKAIHDYAFHAGRESYLRDYRNELPITIEDSRQHCAKIAEDVLHRAKVMSEALEEIQATCLSNRIPTPLTTKDKHNLGLGIRRWAYDRATEALKGESK